MSIKYTEFTAQTDVLGTERIVNLRQTTDYEGEKPTTYGVITIHPVDYHTAMQILERLSGVKAAPVPAEKPAEKKAAAPAKKAAPTKAEPVTATAATAAPEAVAHYEASAARVAQQDAVGVEEPAAKEEPAPPAKEAPPAKAKKAAPAGDVPELPDNIKGTSQMRELLTWLADKGGVTTVERMVEVCTALKDVVPILGKVPDVAARVTKACDVLSLFQPAATDDAA